MSDPRNSPLWKQLRHEQRVLLLLGAILDALKPAAPPPTAELPKPPAARRSTTK